MSEEGMYYHLPAWPVKEEDLPSALDVLKQEKDKAISDTAFIVLDNCIHPEIETAWKGGFETTYQCLKCGKKIAINSFDTHTQEDIHNILYLTFGRSIDILVKANREGRRP